MASAPSCLYRLFHASVHHGLRLARVWPVLTQLRSERAAVEVCGPDTTALSPQHSLFPPLHIHQCEYRCPRIKWLRHSRGSKFNSGPVSKLHYMLCTCAGRPAAPGSIHTPRRQRNLVRDATREPVGSQAACRPVDPERMPRKLACGGIRGHFQRRGGLTARPRARRRAISGASA